MRFPFALKMFFYSYFFFKHRVTEAQSLFLSVSCENYKIKHLYFSEPLCYTKKDVFI